jgi:hypothetical protein
MKKPLLLSGAVVAVGLTGLVGAQAVSAASDTSGQQNLVDKIATTFHLNKTDVQKVFDEEHQTRETQRQQKLQDRLAQAVKDGKLTQGQADQLLAKMKELDSLKDSLQDKTPAERQTAMKSKLQEIRTWVKDNNISQEFWHFGGRGMNSSMQD